MNNSYSVLQRRVRNETNNLRNHLLSIVSDSEKVTQLYELFDSISLYSNKRNGEWYIDRNLIKNHQSCYFKSTDGHDQIWSFSTSRLNLDVIINAINNNNAILIIDSTRRGKQYPDSFRATIPIWLTIINAIVFNNDNPVIDKPPCMSDSHITLINSMLKDMIKNIPKCIVNIIYETLRPIMKFKLKPIWLHQSEEDGEIEWVGEYGDDVVDHLPNIKIDSLGYIPILLFSCSRTVQELDYREYSWRYIQGAGDDEENWCLGLTPDVFWKYKDSILQSDDPNEVELAVRRSVEQFNERVIADDNQPEKVFHIKVDEERRLTVVKQFLSSNLSLDDIIQNIYRSVFYDSSVCYNTNISKPIIIIEPDSKKMITFERIAKNNCNILFCYLNFVKKNAKETNRIWCNEVLPQCIAFFNEMKHDVIIVSSDSCLPIVIATALLCSINSNENNITVDKEVIKSKMALIQSLTSDVVIPRRFNKIINNFFIGEL